MLVDCSIGKCYVIVDSLCKRWVQGQTLEKTRNLKLILMDSVKAICQAEDIVWVVWASIHGLLEESQSFREIRFLTEDNNSA